MAEAVAEAQLSHGDLILTGTYLDMRANLPAVDPTKIKSPTLIMRGEHDGIAMMEDLNEFSDQAAESGQTTDRSTWLGISRHSGSTPTASITLCTRSSICRNAGTGSDHNEG